MSSKVSRLVNHARKYGFISNIIAGNSENLQVVSGGENFQRDVETTKALCEYGPYGSLMRKNIVEQWWNSTITLQERIFPLSVIHNQNDCDDSNDQFNPFLQTRQRALNNFQQYISNIFENEIGIAQVSILPAELKQKLPVLRFPSNEYLTVHYFCPEKKGIHVFNKFVKQRMRWWKKLANKQASFEQHVKEGEDEDKSLKTSSTIGYEYSFGKATVETISLGIPNGNLSKNELNFIECCTSVEQAMLTYLDDSIEGGVKEDFDHEDSQACDVLRLHPRLSPLQAVILAEDKDCEQQTDLVARLCKELKTEGIMCQHMARQDKNTIYQHADAIGTPFCFTVDGRTLQRGVVSLRHRDTAIQEFMHISEVKETLSKILKFI